MSGHRGIIWGLSIALLIFVLACSSADAQASYPLSLQDSAVGKALDSLRSNQSADGSIHGFNGTTAAVWAFAAAGIDPYDVRASEHGPSLMDYLASSSGNLSGALDYAFYILSISASADNPNSYRGHNYTQDLMGTYSGGQFGDASLLYDDMYAVLALVSAGMSTSNPSLNSSYAYIKSHQNADGGWNGTLSGVSDTDNTSLAVLALVSAGESPSSTSITHALNFIKSHQNADGGFGAGTSNPYSDALAIMAIRAAEQNPASTTWAQNGTTPVSNLLSLQRSDGGFWQASNDATAYAVIALVGKLYPIHGYITPLRIEGKNSTLFDDYLFYSTPYTAVADNSGNLFDTFREPSPAVMIETFNDITGTPVYTSDAYGDYFLTGIDGENNSGVVGWRYAVNYAIPSVGAGAYTLQHHDRVVWFYGHPTTTVLSMLRMPQVVMANTTVVAVATYYDQASGTWKPLQGAYVWAAAGSEEVEDGNGAPFWLPPAGGMPIAGPTDASGMVNVSFNTSGTYMVWCAGERTDAYPGGDWTQIARSERGKIEVVSKQCEPTSLWSRTYGGPASEWAEDVKPVFDDGPVGGQEGYVLVGTTNRSGTEDGLLVRTDANGTELWSRTYGGSGNDMLYSVAVLEDGFVLAGTTQSYGAGAWDAWLVRTDANGTELWNRTYGGANSDGARAVYKTVDGGFILAGWRYGTSSDMWLIKTDAKGNEQWSRAFGGSTSADYGYGMTPTADGGYLLVGYANLTHANLTSPTHADMFVVKTDSAGNEQWSKTFTRDNKSIGYAAAQTLDGGYVLAGYTGEIDINYAGFTDAWLVRTDANGTELWNRTYGGASKDEARAVILTPDGGFFVAGYTTSYGVGGSADGWLISTDKNGNELWNRTYGGPREDRLYALQPAMDGLMLAGTTASHGAGNRDAWLLKLGCGMPQGEPDLIVFLGLPHSAGVGEPLHIAGNVWNIGRGPANASTLVVLANGTPIENVPVNPLSSGDDYYFDFNYTPTSGGVLNITAVADYYDVVNESNETNNTATQYVSVGERVPPAGGVGVYVRIESNTSTLFSDVLMVPPECTFTDTNNTSHFIDHPTALGALIEAANRSHFTYNITPSTYGLYITDINGDSWVQYRVNYTSPWVGADQYNLTGGEYVLFATGQYWPFYPLVLIAPPYVPSGASFNATVIYYNDTLADWRPIAGATVLADGTPIGTSGVDGNVSLTLPDGAHELRAEKTGYIRSEKVRVNVSVQPTTTMYMYPCIVWARPNSTFTIAVNVSSAGSVSAALSNITFNTTAFEVVSQTNGSYMNQHGMVPTVVDKGYDNAIGYARYNENVSIPTALPPSSSGTLYTLTLRVKQNAPFGMYMLNFTNVSTLLDANGTSMGAVLLPCIVHVGNNTQPVAVAAVKHLINNAKSNVYLNGSLSYDPDGTIASYLWHFGDGTNASTTSSTTTHVYMHYLWNGTAYVPFLVNLTVFDNGSAYNWTIIPVSVYMAGDANGDGRANILDAALVGLHWQSAYGSAEYSDGADLNNDDVVNILDAAIVGLNWNVRARGDVGFFL